MDLVNGAKKVIVAMEHCTKTGEPKILNRCNMPLTAVRCVDIVVTELCVLRHIENGFEVLAIAPGLSPEGLQQKTEAPLTFAGNLQPMLLAED